MQPSIPDLPDLLVTIASKLNIPRPSERCLLKVCNDMGIIYNTEWKECNYVWKKLCMWYDLSQLKMHGKKEWKQIQNNVNSVDPRVIKL